MTLRSSTTQNRTVEINVSRICSLAVRVRGAFPLICLIVIAFLPDASGQRLAILNPDKNAQTERIVENLTLSLSKEIPLVDSSLSDAAYLSASVTSPFNLTQDESKLIGSAVGCNTFLLVKAETQRRTSSSKSGYYESYAALFLVSSRTGHLIWWRLVNSEGDTATASESQLLNSIGKLAGEISQGWKDWLRMDVLQDANLNYPELPVEGSPEAKNFRAPIPYLRIKPEYTRLAYLYDAKGTVEVMVDLDEKGKVVKTEITRWAGFGLDDAVIDAIRKMNWRPATRNGRPLPSRFLLRYNFKKIEKDQD
jgi:TonB family protein